MEEGAKLLIKTIAANEPIFLQVDSDADGYTSSALLLNWLHRYFPFYVENKITYRVHDGKEHGVIMGTVPEGTKLLILPDGTSSQFEEYESLRRAGVEILILDHHEATHASADACVINNQLCDYPTKGLSGVGIVYKFCSYLDALMNRTDADDFLDLVAVGVIADMMSLHEPEVRRIVNVGLSAINNPFIHEMMVKNEYSIGGKLSPFKVSFYIAPFINSVSRVGTRKDKELLFESMLEYKAYEKILSTKRGHKTGEMEPRVIQCCRNCTNLKNHQDKDRDKTLETIEDYIMDNDLLDNKVILVTLPEDADVEKNLAGLVANQVANKYQMPTMVLKYNPERKAYFGSARNYGKNDLVNFREFFERSGMAELAAGHASAFGAGIKECNIKPFLEYANYKLRNYDFTTKYLVDFIYDANSINSADILTIADYAWIWGQSVEEPYIVIKNVKITSDNLALLKDRVLKITLPNGITIIKMKNAKNTYEELKTNGYKTIDIVGRCSRNEWMGNISAEVHLEDYNIIAESAYYF